MIAVGVPAFDRKMSNNNGTTVRSARLLGVASTDVPVEDINKLSLPYKVSIGLNLCNVSMFILFF